MVPLWPILPAWPVSVQCGCVGEPSQGVGQPAPALCAESWPGWAMAEEVRIKSVLAEASLAPGYGSFWGHSGICHPSNLIICYFFSA